MDIKDRIRALRKQNSMTQTQLAEKIGVTLRCIQNYESGTRYPRRNFIEKLCKEFNVSYEYLLGNSNDINNTDEAQIFLQNASMIFAGGKLSEDDKDKVMLALQKIYWEAKEINRLKSEEKESEDSEEHNKDK